MPIALVRLFTSVSFASPYLLTADNVLGVSRLSLKEIAAIGQIVFRRSQNLTDREVRSRRFVRSRHSALPVTAGRGADAAPQRAVDDPHRFPWHRAVAAGRLCRLDSGGRPRYDPCQSSYNSTNPVI